MTGAALLTFVFFTAASSLRLNKEDSDQPISRKKKPHPLALYEKDSFSSMFFMHLTHTGGTSLRSAVFSKICERNGWLHCWESQVDDHGKTIPALEETRNQLDLLFGHFGFNSKYLTDVMKGPTLLMTILRDPYESARSNYYHSLSSTHPTTLAPGEFLKKWPDMHLKRLSGLAPEQVMCEQAKKNLREFHLITETKLLDDFSSDLFDQLQRIWPNLAIQKTPMEHQKQLASQDDRRSQFDHQISESDRAEFNKKHACAYEVLELGRTLPSYWHGS